MQRKPVSHRLITTGCLHKQKCCQQSMPSGRPVVVFLILLIFIIIFIIINNNIFIIIININFVSFTSKDMICYCTDKKDMCNRLWSLWALKTSGRTTPFLRSLCLLGWLVLGRESWARRGSPGWKKVYVQSNIVFVQSPTHRPAYERQEGGFTASYSQSRRNFRVGYPFKKERHDVFGIFSVFYVVQHHQYNMSFPPKRMCRIFFSNRLCRWCTFIHSLFSVMFDDTISVFILMILIYSLHLKFSLSH